MKKLAGLLLVLAVVAPASAVNLLVNGDFSAGETGWTRWAAPWGASNYAVGPTDLQYLNQGQQGSFGLYQVVPVPASEMVEVSADWAGDINGAGWAEVMLYTSADPNANWANIADTGNASDIAFKKDSWGMNPPTAWTWQAASLSPHPSGNGGVIHSEGYVCVATKLGSVSGSAVGVEFDNIVLTPEPATMLLLGIPVLFLRRRRA
jgi:hypothetical protein